MKLASEEISLSPGGIIAIVFRGDRGLKHDGKSWKSETGYSDRLSGRSRIETFFRFFYDKSGLQIAIVFRGDRGLKHHIDPWHVQVFESEKVQKLADLKRRELTASIGVEQAIARLDEAKLNYQKQQYQHSRYISDYQVALQKQQEQVNSLQTQLDKVDEELEQLTSVYSPYRGKVRRVKVLGQTERSINVEVTLDIRGGK